MNASVTAGLAWPRPRETHIWQLHLAKAQNSLGLWSTWLSADEADRAQRFVRGRDRDRFILSRGGLRGLLAQYLGCSPQSLLFAYGKHGKPSLANPTVDLHFNLAHSGAWVVYGFSLCPWIGVDIETIAQRGYLEALIQRCLTPNEQANLPQSTSARLQRFFQYWTVKEAHLKAVGLGLNYPMTKVEVALDTSVRLVLTAPVAQTAIADWTVQLWLPQADVVAASCVGELSSPPLIRSFSQFPSQPNEL